MQYCVDITQLLPCGSCNALLYKRLHVSLCFYARAMLACARLLVKSLCLVRAPFLVKSFRSICVKPFLVLACECVPYSVYALCEFAVFTATANQQINQWKQPIDRRKGSHMPTCMLHLVTCNDIEYIYQTRLPTTDLIKFHDLQIHFNHWQALVNTFKALWTITTSTYLHSLHVLIVYVYISHHNDFNS